ncbi:MAG: DNA repair and recombination protein RadA [Candidatus Undinarchaeales archaeon]|jgi:DNA repair protein RadA|nr:DNA repair and recombination protein RadA [Candidatus Undinarchaeales archaeon]MDP7493986.1 DNA repair and recombination protein RadA [Candidatus Undinarchaeales archaeon]
MDPTIEELPGIGPKTAEKLREVGYIDVLAIAAASSNELMAAADMGESLAMKVIAAAQQVLDIGFETGLDVLEKRKKVVKVTTMSTQVDELLGGGVQSQAITEVHGPFGSGKSQIAFQIAVSAQLPVEKGGLDGHVAFIDTENTFRPERIMGIAEALGLDPEEVLGRIHIARAFNSDHQMFMADKVEELINKDEIPIKIIIVDSLTAHFRAEYAGRGKLAERQQKLNRLLHNLQRMADIHNLVVFVTNQVMSKPDVFFGPTLEAIGGNIVGHAATYRLFLRRGKGGKRVARLIDSPDLPEGEAIYSLTSEGVRD